jgi:hypothetical protein
MRLLYADPNKYPIKKIAACPGPMNKDQLKRLDDNQVLFFDFNAPEESLQKIFPEPPNEDANTKKQEEEKGQQNGQGKGQENGKEKGQEKGRKKIQVESKEKIQVERKNRCQEITEADKKKLMAAIVFLLSCHIYQKENSNLKGKLLNALEKKDLTLLKEIYEDEKCFQKIVEEVVADQQKEEILDKSLEGRSAKLQTEALRSMAHIDETTKKQRTRIATFLSKEYHFGNTYVFLDPIQQQIVTDKNPRQLILGSAGTGKTVLLQLKAWDLLKEDPACKVLIILPLKGVVDVYKSHFGSDFEERLFMMNFREDWEKITEDHKPHILIDEFAYIQVAKHFIINR